MPPHLTFLGWGRPILPAAAAHLVGHYAQGGAADLRGAVVVLPGGRARRRMVELLVEEAAARKLTLVPPEVVTVGAVPDLLHQPALPAADGMVARRAWSRALRDTNLDALKVVFPHLEAGAPLREWDVLAELLAGMHRTLAGEGHRFSDVVRINRTSALFDDSPRWDVLARVEKRYLALLHEAGMADPFDARLAALEEGIRRHEGDVWLVSVAELPAVTRRLLEASGATLHALVQAPAELASSDPAAFDAWGLPVTEHWEAARVPVTDEVLRMVERPVDQADAALSALEDLEGAYTTEDVVMGVHPQSEVVPYLQQRLAARGVGARYAAGTQLMRTAPARLLQAAADFLDGHTYPALAALLRHPDASALLRLGGVEVSGAEALDVADAYFGEHLPYKLEGQLPRGRERGGAGSADGDAHAPDFPSLVHALDSDAALGAFHEKKEKKRKKRLSEWMTDVTRLLEGAYGARELDRSKPDDRHLVDVLGEIRGAALALHRLPGILDEECSGAEALRAVLAGLEGEALPPDPDPTAVELLEWLEIPLDDAPVLVLTGFNEGFVPDSVNGHPFLPDSLCRLLGVLDNRRRLARDAYRLTCVLHSRERVRIIAGRSTAKGDPLRPSRLMFRTDPTALAPRVLRFLEGRDAASPGMDLAALGLEPAEESGFGTPPEPIIELAPHELPTSLSVTAFTRLMDDAYRFVLEDMLGLERVDDDAREMDPMVFGDVAHRALQRFGRMALADPPQVDAADEDAVAEVLVRTLRQEVANRFGRSALPAVQLQAAQLEERLRAFAARQAAWAAQGWQIRAVECKPAGAGWPLDVDGTPMLLKARIDRIDHNPRTGEWAVLDYKTSTKRETPEEAHRRGRGDAKEWKNLQLPLYRHMLDSVVGPAGDPVVPSGGPERAHVRVGYVVLPQDPAECGFLLAEWSEEEMATALDAAREAVRTLRRGRFSVDDAPTWPGEEGWDALRPLLVEGWQASGDADEGDGDAGSGDGAGGEAGGAQRSVAAGGRS
ncbi:MAG TPA: PD-(D/E)XK nuclease family protein [Longimicrobiales bacterium]|nr:PD-(D/E)XK nuclease family protein [Longimicrobiales bacterium]